METKLKAFNISSWPQTIIGAVGTIFLILLIISVIFCFLHPEQGPTGCAIGFGFMLMLLLSPAILLCGLGVIKIRKVISAIAIVIILIPLSILISGLIGWIMSGCKR